MRRKWWDPPGWELLVVLTVTFVLLLITVSADAHPVDEIEQWEEGWYERVYGQGVLSPDLVSELVDWVGRHPEYYFDPTYAASSWESLIQIYFEPEDWQWARDVIDCESEGDPDAYHSGSGASGLWQFIPSTWAFSKPWADASPFDPTAAFMAASWLEGALGKGQWHCTYIEGYG